MDSFRQSLQTRVEQVTQQLRGRTPLLLLSGGSASSLLALAWSRYFKSVSSMPVTRALYLQFEDYIWLEREAARKLASDCQFEFREQNLSERSIVTQSFTPMEFWVQALDRVELMPNEVAVTGFGWPQVRRGLSGQPSIVCESPIGETPAENSERIDFFDGIDGQVWKAFLQEERTHMFFELFGDIPFPSIRYWQDFVFKAAIPEFAPCPEWKVDEYLTLNLRPTP